MESHNLAIGISGSIASGKTTLANILSSKLQFQTVSFGNYVRKVAKSKGIKLEREKLQELGENLVNRDLKSFCEQTIKQGNWVEGEPIIIEGIRHLSVLEYFEKRFGEDHFKLIYIDTPKNTRRKRFINRDAKKENLNFSKLNAHSTEIDLESKLRNEADLILDGTASLNQLLEVTLKSINTNESIVKTLKL